MRWHIIPTSAVVLSLIAVLVAGCAGAEPPAAETIGAARGSAAPAGQAPSPTGAAVAELPQGDEPVDLDPADFTPDIDNPYWPMPPGTRWIYREIDEEGNELKVVVTVTGETERIANGITARVVRDTVTEDGQLVEDTKDWYAQDAQGNIWYLGEDTAEFENNEITSREGSWEAGIDGALAGVIIPADPAPGMRYRQEYYAGEAEDNGEVLSTNELVEVPYGKFRDALLTKDTVATEPDVQEYKLYAGDVGPVLVLGVSGGGGREELVAVDRVGAAAGTGPLGSPHP